MNKKALAVAGLLACGPLPLGCGDNNPINAQGSATSATLNVTAHADVMNVVASESLPLTVDTGNLVLVAPNDTPPADHAADAVYLEFHLDDETTPPLLVTADRSVTVTIPASTGTGTHNIICRAHRHDDGSPTDVSFFLAIDVTRNDVPSTALF
jgi:hypothetical protein